MPESDKMVTVEKAAELLGVCTRTIYNWIWSNKIPYLQIGGVNGKYLLAWSDIEKRKKVAGE